MAKCDGKLGKCVFAAILVFLLSSLLKTATAAEAPYFDIYAEIEIEYSFKKLTNQKAFAMGLDNYGWFASGYQTMSQARNEALKGCRSRIQKIYGKNMDTKCQIVAENKKIVWKGPRLPSLKTYRMKEQDYPLLQARYYGNPKEADAIILKIHGCDGQSLPDEPWSKGWNDFLVNNRFAIIEPNSFANAHKVVCGFKVPYATTDDVFRLRVAQTIRTLAGIKKLYPGKQIYLWGHSQGGLIAQFYDYDVEKILITGANCLYNSAHGKQRVFHVFGSKDPYSPLDDVKTDVTEKKVRANCPAYKKKGRRSFLIVQGEDHWVDIGHEDLRHAVEKFFEGK
jgi:hypothetical protein